MAGRRAARVEICRNSTLAMARDVRWTGAVSPPAELACHRSTGSRSVKAAGSGPAETRPAMARQVARRHMKRYLDLENYTNNLRRIGWSDADIAQNGSDALVDAIVAWGGADAIQARVREHRRRGADHVCLQVLRADPAASPTRDLETLAKTFRL